MGFDDTMKNKANEFLGGAKEKLGAFTGDADTEAEGRADKLEAKGAEFLNQASEKLEGVKGALADAGEQVQANLEAGIEKVKGIFGGKDEAEK
ncbi:CsbD family protein [Arcanobacterium hippocoleae]